MSEEKKFNYTYSAPSEAERTEIEEIRSKYLPIEERSEKLKKMKKLDSKVKNIPSAVSLFVGIFGLLLFGLGLTMVLEWSMYVFGIIVAAVGVFPISLAHLVYGKLSKKLKNKYSAEILGLSEELLNEKTDK